MRCVLAALASMSLTPAFATDLVNKDDRPYAVSIAFGASVVKADIKGKSVKIGVCASTAAKCVVTVDGVGEIEVTGADDVVIENARLSKK